MKRIKNYGFWASIITTISVLTSCPTSPPLAPSDGFNPYLAPKEPSTVEATNGYADSITLTWEKVEDATSYQVWATPVDQYGMVTNATSGTETYYKLIARGFDLVDVVTESSCKLRDLEAGTAYIFAVVAMKDMKDTRGTTVLYSEPSPFVEGATFGDITLSAVATSETITLFWNISNLYSVLDESREKNALYNYNVAIYKKLSSSSTWEEDKKLTSDEAKKHSFSLETSSLEIDSSYDFKLRLDVLDTEGNVVNTVESDTFTITTDSTPSPSNVENISATNGLKRHEVTLTWTAPKLTDRDDIVSLFKVERTKDSSTDSGTNNLNRTWTEIEASVTQNSDGTYSITDTTLEDNAIYAYRIINGYQIGEKTQVYQKEDYAAVIQDVYSLWMPEDIKFTFSSRESKKEGQLQVSYTYNPPETNPSSTIKCYIGGTYWTEKDLSTHNKLEKQEVDYSCPTYNVSIENINPLTYYSFYFIFTVNDEELVNITSSQDFTLGETAAVNLIDNFTATGNWVKAICLTWNETDAITSSPENFDYEIYQDNIKLDNVSVSGTDSTKSAYIVCEDGVSHNYRIKVTSKDDSMFEVEEAKGSTLAIPTGLEASDGTSIKNITITWPQLNDEKIIYTLKYSYDCTTWYSLSASTSTPEGSSTPVGSASLQAKADGTDGNPVNFKLVISNSEQLASGLANSTAKLESEIETGCVLGPALLNVRIENNGLDPDKITIKWNKVIGADHYRVMRNDTLLPWKKDSNIYEDSVSAIKALSDENALNASYTYTVIPCLEDDTQAVITSLSTTAIATGKLFAPPTNINATKGGKGITLTWNAVENATAYQIEKYIVELKNGEVVNQVQTGEAITVNSSGKEIETYEEKDKSLLSNNVLYKVGAVLKDGTTSQLQDSYNSVINSLGFEEASNIGYKLQEVSDFNISSVTDEDGNYAEYTKVTWYMVPGATSYTIKSYTGSSKKTLVGELTVSVDELTYSKEETVDNGKEGKGFLSYNPIFGLYTYYDGNINFKDSYEITNYEIIANNGTGNDMVSSGTTNRNTTVYVQPKAKDWVNIILNIISPAFKAANTNFGGDWWINNWKIWENPTKTYTYPNTGMTFNLKTTGLDASYTSSNNYLSISPYTDANAKLTLSTPTDIQFAIDNSDTDGLEGNLGIDPLKIIGAGNNGIIKAIPTVTGIKTFTINFDNVNVYSSSGEFNVTINGIKYKVENTDDLPRILGD